MADTPYAAPGGIVPPRRLGGFRDRHAGETLLVCGLGQSLSTLTDPARFVTIGVNDVGRLFHPDYLVVLNSRAQFTRERFRHIERSEARVVFTQLALDIPHPHVVRFALGPRAGTELDNPDVLPHARNSPYLAITLALFMGARRIGVLGVDYTDHHFFARDGRHPLTPSLPQMDAEYRRLYEVWWERGVEIYNLSAISRVTAFPKLSLDEFAALPPPDPVVPRAPGEVAPGNPIRNMPAAVAPPRHPRLAAAAPPPSPRRLWVRTPPPPAAAPAPPPPATSRAVLPVPVRVRLGRRPAPVRAATITMADRNAPPAQLAALETSGPRLDLAVVIVPGGGWERAALVPLVMALAPVCELVAVTGGEAPLVKRLMEITGGRHVECHAGPGARAAAMNLGAAHARTAKVLWLDGATFVDPAFLRAAVEEMDERRLDTLVPWRWVHPVSADTLRRVAEGCHPPKNGSDAAAACSRYGAVATPLLAATAFVRSCGGVCEEAHGCEAQAWFVRASLFGRAAATRRAGQRAWRLASPEPVPTPAGYAVLREMRSISSRDHFVRRFPASSTFCADVP